MAVQPDGPAPYAPASAVIDVVRQHRDRGLPTPITTEVIGRAGVTEALAPRVMKTLTLFDLVDDEGQETDQFTELAKSPESEFKERFAAVLRAAYADVFQYIDPATSPPDHVRDQFRHYRPRGQQERMVTLFMGLCEYTGLAPEGSTQRREPSKPREGQRRTASQQDSKNGRETRTQRNGGRGDDEKPPPPPDTAEHPFIRGLLQTLPKTGTEWPLEAREKWTRAALAAFDLIYDLPPNDESEGDDR